VQPVLIGHICNMNLDKQTVCKKIGVKIREIRTNKGLSIEKLANEAGIDYTQLSRIELGKINTSVYQVYVISNSLSVSVPEIFQNLD
jgi:transcriptional regulator with XRE-family HTH domain